MSAKCASAWARCLSVNPTGGSDVFVIAERLLPHQNYPLTKPSRETPHFSLTTILYSYLQIYLAEEAMSSINIRKIFKIILYRKRRIYCTRSDPLPHPHRPL